MFQLSRAGACTRSRGTAVVDERVLKLGHLKGTPWRSHSGSDFMVQLSAVHTAEQGGRRIYTTPSF